MSEDTNSKVVLELPRFIINAERLGGSIAVRRGSVDFHHCPNHLSSTSHVLMGEGSIVIPREVFDKCCAAGLRWEFLGDLPRRGFIVNWGDHEFALASEPAEGHTGDVPYTPATQTEWGDMQRRTELTAEEWERLNRPMRIK